MKRRNHPLLFFCSVLACVLWMRPASAELCGTTVTQKRIDEIRALATAFAALDTKLSAYHTQGAMFPQGDVLERYRATRAGFEQKLKTVQDDIASCRQALVTNYIQLDEQAKQIKIVLDRAALETREEAATADAALLDPIWHWIPTTNDPLAKEQYHVRTLGFGEGLLDAGSEPVIVAVIDDGVQTDHEDLREAMWINADEIPGNYFDDDRNGYLDDTYGWNFIDKNNAMTPKGDHGTAVASLIAAKPNNALGITGVGGNVRIMPITVCGSQGCSLDSITQAVTYAVNNGAKVINLSLGTDGYVPYAADLDAAINVASLRNIIVVTAAGNGDRASGLGRDTGIFRLSPVCNGYNEHAVIGVAATDSFHDVVSWSDYGSCADTRAPGYGIMAASVSSVTGKTYGAVYGTSFAAPLITSMVVRMLQIDPKMTPIEARALLLRHTRLGMPYFADIAAAMKPQPAAPQVQAPAPASSPSVTAYVKSTERIAAVSINADKKLQVMSDQQPCVSNTLIKGTSSAAVYYCGANGKRFVFPNTQTFLTWYEDFDDVLTITDEALSKVPIGGLVTYRPGTRMLKIQSDPKVYAVAANGELRPIESEAAAKKLYGDDWNKQIDDISDAFFVNYRVGAAITESLATQ